MLFIYFAWERGSLGGEVRKVVQVKRDWYSISIKWLLKSIG